MKIGKNGFSKWSKATAAAGIFLLISGTCRPVWAAFLKLPAYDETEEIMDGELEDFSEEEWKQLLDSYENDIQSGDPESTVHIKTILDPEMLLESGGEGELCYTLPNLAAFTTNVPDGMVTAQEVFMNLPDRAVGTVKKDDEETSLIGSGVFSEAGNYELKLVFYQPTSLESEDLNVYEVRFSFEIIDELNSSVNELHAPDGFEISEVYKDGVLQKEEGVQSVLFQEDGNYEIRYRDLETGTIWLKTQFTRDTEAPFLSFSKDITERRVTGPVEFTASEPDCTVMVTYNGNRGQLTTNTLTYGGFYVLDVIDQAGNSRSYQLNIRQTYRLFDTKLVIMACIGFAGLAAWLYYLRNNMRVM